MTDKAWGTGFTAKVIWSIVRQAASDCSFGVLAPHDLRRTCARLCHQAGGELEQIQFLLGHVSVQTEERYLGFKQRLRNAANDQIGLEPEPPWPGSLLPSRLMVIDLCTALTSQIALLSRSYRPTSRGGGTDEQIESCRVRDHERRHDDDRNETGRAQLTGHCTKATTGRVVIVEHQVDSPHGIEAYFSS